MNKFQVGDYVVRVWLSDERRERRKTYDSSAFDSIFIIEEIGSEHDMMKAIDIEWWQIRVLATNTTHYKTVRKKKTMELSQPKVGDLCLIIDPRQGIDGAAQITNGEPIKIHGEYSDICVGDVLLVSGTKETQTGWLLYVMKHGKEHIIHSFWCKKAK